MVVALPQPHAGAGSSVPSRRAALLAVAGDLIAEHGYSRTSLRDVAEAAGIQAGSIYHHFPSKAMLAVELVAAFHHDLDEVSWGWTAVPPDPIAAVHGFAQQVAGVAGRHRAALHLCMYDAPSTAGEELSSIVHRRPESLDRRWASLLRAAAEQGRLRPEVDLTPLGAVLLESVMVLGRLPGGHPLPELVTSLTDLLLGGLAPAAPTDAELDASDAAASARAVVAGWAEPAAATGRPRREAILAAARHEFARRGYEATTVRDIADAAGMRASSLYRHFDSKQAMVSAIIGGFSHTLLAAMRSIVAAGGSATAALDAIMLLMCSATTHFRPEFAILRAWWRTLDSEVPEPFRTENAERLDLLQGVLERGVESGECRRPAHPRLLPLALRDVIWMPLRDVSGVSTAEHLAFLRTCLLRGAAS